MVSSRKNLRLETTAGPSNRRRAASKETAANTPTETATLRGGLDTEDGPNSDAGSSHGEPTAEPQDEESHDGEETPV